MSLGLEHDPKVVMSFSRSDGLRLNSPPQDVERVSPTPIPLCARGQPLPPGVSTIYEFRQVVHIRATLCDLT